MRGKILLAVLAFSLLLPVVARGDVTVNLRQAVLNEAGQKVGFKTPKNFYYPRLEIQEGQWRLVFGSTEAAKEGLCKPRGRECVSEWSYLRDLPTALTFVSYPCQIWGDQRWCLDKDPKETVIYEISFLSFFATPKVAVWWVRWNPEVGWYLQAIRVDRIDAQVRQALLKRIWRPTPSWGWTDPDVEVMGHGG